MVNFFRRLFSPKTNAAKLERKLKESIARNNQVEIISNFCEGFLFHLQKEDAALLSNLILSYISKIEDISLMKTEISNEILQQTLSF